MKFEYTGDPLHDNANDPESITAVGRKSGKHYAFRLGGAAVEVDSEDTDQFRGNRHFTERRETEKKKKKKVSKKK